MLCRTLGYRRPLLGLMVHTRGIFLSVFRNWYQHIPFFLLLLLLLYLFQAAWWAHDRKYRWRSLNIKVTENIKEAVIEGSFGGNPLARTLD